jgi:hypothetical protein
LEDSATLRERFQRVAQTGLMLPRQPLGQTARGPRRIMRCYHGRRVLARSGATAAVLSLVELPVAVRRKLDADGSRGRRERGDTVRGIAPSVCVSGRGNERCASRMIGC